MNNIEADTIINTYDLHARYEELKMLVEWNPHSLDEEQQRDWDALQNMENYISDFWYGETLVNDDYFTEYTRQLADDIGYITPEMHRWPYSHIDWEAAADELRGDYTKFEWQGHTYLARA